MAVVVPACNMANVLAGQLGALAAQAGEGVFDIVVVDNGSTDGTGEVARACARRMPGIRVVDAPSPRSSAYARNVGAQATTAEGLLFCDADDLVAPGWVAAMAGALDQHELVMGRFDHQRLNPPVIAALMAGVAADAPPIGYQFLPYAFTANLGVRRRLFDALGGFRPEFTTGGDLDFSWRAQLAGSTLQFAPAAVVHRRWPQDLWGLARQQARYATAAAKLYHDYADCGMPPSSPLRAAGDWLALLIRTPELAVASRRGEWCLHASHRFGRLVGSARTRALYL